MFSKTPYNPRNVYVKTIITLFSGLGIGLAVISTMSCRWFDYDSASFHARDVIGNKNHTASFGLFRYYTKTWIIHDPVSTTITNSEQCVPYEPLFVGNRFSMMYTAQISVILGPIFAFMACLLGMIAINKRPINLFLLMSTTVQCVSVVASMSWCDDFASCQWLLGSIVNTIAAALFFFSWLLSIWGLVKEHPSKEVDVDDSSVEEEDEDEEEEDTDHPEMIEVASNHSRESSMDVEGQQVEEAVPQTAREIRRKLSTNLKYLQDVLGTSNKVIVNAMARVVKDREQNNN
ncbi:hypothetical protein IV203_016045 [Nitzschia inconspicua]|uniref:Uncharacterized protein n=1 Tax=Nitzschia inconspicua TaxID=303405 RepID=A0A9K3KQJ6_9STRA|nr:hypothetical protein IV203_016045 [Nitzschia inconspicua]